MVQSYRVVSNTAMRRMFSGFLLLLLLLTIGAWAQPSSVDATGRDAIRRAKGLIVSALDGSLPNVSLEFFLNYEAGGAPVKWKTNDCADGSGRALLDREQGTSICVEADFEFKRKTEVRVLVAFGTFERESTGAPALMSLTITQSGVSRPLRRLGDLPGELHRRAPKLPRDLPAPVAGL